MNRLIWCLVFGIVLWGPGGRTALGQPLQVNSEAVLAHLNQGISWYLHLARSDVSAGRPSDALYLQNARTLARQAIQLAFQSAQEQAVLLQGEATGPIRRFLPDSFPISRKSPERQPVLPTAPNRFSRRSTPSANKSRPPAEKSARTSCPSAKPSRRNSISKKLSRTPWAGFPGS